MEHFYVSIRFYQELNFFISKEKQYKEIVCSAVPGQTVKDLIESRGVPHVEVDLILINSRSVGFSEQLNKGDRISVYPVFERLNIQGVSKVRPTPLRRPKFIADVHLGTLTSRLRTAGFPVEYDPVLDDPELARKSSQENLILLTRDKGLLKRKIVVRGLYIRNTLPDLQFREVIARLDLYDQIKPFSLCPKCGAEIVVLADKELNDIKSEIPPGVLKWCNKYSKCSGCDKIFWPGSHLNKMYSLLSQLESDRKEGWTGLNNY